MIESITITDTMPFVGVQPALQARTLNYVFGANGVGKTTISRVIDHPETYPMCRLAWQGGRPVQTCVLNQDFVDENFGQMKGIFTLGEQQKGARENIDAAHGAIQGERSKREGLRQTLEGGHGDSGKSAELVVLEDKYEAKFWAQQVKHKAVFADAFAGTRNDKKKFKAKILAEGAENNAELKSYPELEAHAKTVFGDRPVEQDSIPAFDASALLALETASILKKPVIGKSDVDIAAMIERLGNFDWVRKGLLFYHANDSTCPFCQQKTGQAFADSLAAYFDETYAADKQAIDDLVSDYKMDAGAMQQSIADVLAVPHEFPETEKLQAQKDVLDGLIRENLLILKGKQDMPSRVTELKSLTNAMGAIKELIDAAKTKVAEHNRMVRNFDEEKRALKAQVWRYVLNDLDQDLQSYEREKSGLESAIQSLTRQIADCDARIKQKGAEIRELEKQTVSIQPTVDFINDILKKFGFTSFSLAIGEDERSYKLVRPNGEEVGKTLSEGEKSFVVFLYFYHSLRGSTEETGITADRVVVFDDPVSSLDSDILFIVSSLIREVCEEARVGNGHIKQVFVLTHNVYFHREVTFRQRRSRASPKDEAFWVVRKCASGSWVKGHRNNPINTSYELLWREVREADPANPGLENTLRRILEYYFKVIGCTPLEQLCEKFDGPDKLICQSLISWTHAGSHNILDPSFVTPSDISTENRLRVFRQIFEESGQGGHYELMTRNGSAAPHDGVGVAVGKEEQG